MATITNNGNNTLTFDIDPNATHGPPGIYSFQVNLVPKPELPTDTQIDESGETEALPATCPICYDEFSDSTQHLLLTDWKVPVKTECNHIFCISCVRMLFHDRRNTCPMCRTEMFPAVPTVQDGLAHVHQAIRNAADASMAAQIRYEGLYQDFQYARTIYLRALVSVSVDRVDVRRLRLIVSERRQASSLAQVEARSAREAFDAAVNSHS